MKNILIHKAKIINEGNSFKGSVLIEGEKITKIFKDEVPENILKNVDEIVHERERLYKELKDIQEKSNSKIIFLTSFYNSFCRCTLTTTRRCFNNTKIILFEILKTDIQNEQKQSRNQGIHPQKLQIIKLPKKDFASSCNR